MSDFIHISHREVRPRGEAPHIQVRPRFVYSRTKDILVRGERFYAVYLPEQNVWSRDTIDLIELVDREVAAYAEKLPEEIRENARVTRMSDHSSGLMAEFLTFCRQLRNVPGILDQTLVFKSDKPARELLSSKRLAFDIREGATSAYDELMTVLYEPEELAKLEWAVGSVLTGHSKELQKFFVIYGDPGTGKSTYWNLVWEMFGDYVSAMNVGWLGNSSMGFPLEQFSNDPLISIDQDADLSKIDGNAVLNSLISHDTMMVNEKGKPVYHKAFNTILFVATNSLVKISDSRSGLLRRLVDVSTTGHKVSHPVYRELTNRMRFEHGAIAHKCKERFLEMGPDAYDGYIPEQMLYGTNILHDFLSEHWEEIAEMEYVQIYELYKAFKTFAEAAEEQYIMPRRVFRTQLLAYFEYTAKRTWRDGKQLRNVAWGFKKERFDRESMFRHEAARDVQTIELSTDPSLVDVLLADAPAQYASESGTPLQKWDDVTTTLKDLDTSRLHYVKPPLNHIVIDFDLTDEEGNKSAERNVEAARQWPPTYTERSKGGAGLHLHYLYDGDAEKLSRVFAPGVEVKVFVGNSSLRRKLTLSTGERVPVAAISSGLPLRAERVISKQQIQSEKGLRALIERNLRKEIHGGTKPSMDFIHKILEDAYSGGLVYDVSDLRSRITSFAMNSTNQAQYCLRLLKDLKWASEEKMEEKASDSDKLVFFDVEVFPNLFTVCWKFEGEGMSVVRMINPTPLQVGELFKLNLVGFYNRNYDNHILWARYLGYDNEQLYKYSNRLVGGDRDARFANAYGISYADVYDYASTPNKKSLKRWQIELGLNHVEMGLSWDEPVPEDLWEEVIQYNANDVITTEQVHNKIIADFHARQILADLSGLPVNATTNNHSAQIIFGTEKEPQDEFVYTDLATGLRHLGDGSELGDYVGRVSFPGYSYEWGKSQYKGVDPSEGGYVFSKPGYYRNVTCFDVAGMHPASIRALNLFGESYTKKFGKIVDARLAIKHRKYDQAAEILGENFRKYLEDLSEANGLANALKVVVNSVYGLTSASFPNRFKDPRNIDNIVAKRGALFMIDLMEFVEALGFEVVHIKTDSIKVVDATLELEEKILGFGRSYGYEFEVENIYEKLCLVNKAVCIGKKDSGKWEAVGIEFQRPFVYKTLLSHEPIGFVDFVEIKQVQTAIFLKEENGEPEFLGRVGGFVPVLQGGVDLLRSDAREEGKFSHVSGTKGWKWREAEFERIVSDGRYDNIDMSYFQHLVDEALSKLREFGDPEEILA